MLRIILITACCLLLVVSAQAQNAAEVAAGLRAQLAEVKTQQTDLQLRLQTLDEALKPENIQNSLAGVGSTRPEDLREQRRRQLETEKAGVVAQLERLSLSQRRLENAVAAAEAAAYQQSAQPPSQAKGPYASDTADLPKPNKRTRPVRRARRKKPVRKVSSSLKRNQRNSSPEEDQPQAPSTLGFKVGAKYDAAQHRPYSYRSNSLVSDRFPFHGPSRDCQSSPPIPSGDRPLFPQQSLGLFLRD
ncbi:MAG TPA: hypothetical protein VN643_19840 [Pyrinomonadaceae bacterium]|nr:hypothetical protein [Pyrinomonadaceae bacterium]